MSLQIETLVGKNTHAFAPRDLSDWGHYSALPGLACRPERMRANEQLIEQLGAKTSPVRRGLGRSYGDAACNSEGITILTERLNRLPATSSIAMTLTLEMARHGDALQLVARNEAELEHISADLRTRFNISATSSKLYADHVESHRQGLKQSLASLGNLSRRFSSV